MSEPKPSTHWSHARLAVLDTETTGLNPEGGDRVIEVAVVHFEGGEVTDRWSTLVDPGAPLHADVTRITGIRDEDVRGQPRFSEIAGELLGRLHGRILVAYNAPFDRGFLVHELARMGLTLPEGAKWLDPLVFAKQMQRGQGAMKLGVVAKRLGIALTEAHRASGDAECAGHVLQALAQGNGLPDDLAAVLDLQERWEAEQDAERAGWKSRAGRGRTGQVALEQSGPRNALGPGYPLSDELDPIRFLYLRAAGRV